MTWRRRLDDMGVLFALLIIGMVFAVFVGPGFVRGANLELMARQAAIVCVAAFGMTMVIVSGGIDLSVGSVVALSTVVTAVVLRDGMSPLTATVAAVAIAAACGLLNGLLIAGLRVV